MFEIDKKQFGEFIADMRRQKMMTQKELAGKLFVSDKAVSKWECGLSMPDITLLKPLCDGFSVSIWWESDSITAIGNISCRWDVSGPWQVWCSDH